MVSAVGLRLDRFLVVAEAGDLRHVVGFLGGVNGEDLDADDLLKRNGDDEGASAQSIRFTSSSSQRRQAKVWHNGAATKAKLSER